MEFEFDKSEIKLNKIISPIDEFVIDFLDILNGLEIKHVFISGYVVLLFGRQRITEDVDMFLEDLDESKLKVLYETLLQKNYWMINAGSFDSAKKLYEEGIAWRAAKKDTISPNMEIKRPKNSLDFISLNNPAKVILNNKHKINISPLELQIPYKLHLGSRKDIEDARYLYDLFKDKIDEKLMKSFAKELKVASKMVELVH